MNRAGSLFSPLQESRLFVACLDPCSSFQFPKFYRRLAIIRFHYPTPLKSLSVRYVLPIPLIPVRPSLQRTNSFYLFDIDAFIKYKPI